jgi:hypothetical protein
MGFTGNAKYIAGFWGFSESGAPKLFVHHRIGVVRKSYTEKRGMELEKRFVNTTAVDLTASTTSPSDTRTWRRESTVTAVTGSLGPGDAGGTSS